MGFKAAFTLLSPSGHHAKLSILIFHRVLPSIDPLFPDEPDVERFDTLMRWVVDWFNVLQLDEAVSRLRNGTLPARAAAITFDDGYADNYLHALPVLQRYRLPATFFISTGFLDGGRMWNDTLIESVRKASVESFDAMVPGVPHAFVRTSDEKRKYLARLIPAIKHLPPGERDGAVAKVADAARAHLPDDLMLSSGQVRALRSAGMLIGGHTVSHPILAATDDVWARREIAEGKEVLEGILGERVGLFAYPNGKLGSDYDRRHVEMVKSVGFDAAVSTHWGVNTAAADPFQLNRFTPWDRSRTRFGLRMLRKLWS